MKHYCPTLYERQKAKFAQDSAVDFYYKLTAGFIVLYFGGQIIRFLITLL